MKSSDLIGRKRKQIEIFDDSEKEELHMLDDGAIKDIEEFGWVDENDAIKSYQDKRKFDSKSFGIVIYGDNSMYDSDIEKNKSIHFKHTKEEIFYCLLVVLHEQIGNRRVKEAVIGHEHGEKNSKCHMQVYIRFFDRIHTSLKPSNFEYEGEKFLYMAQSARSCVALKKYCKKEGDYIEIEFDGKTLYEILDDEKMLHNKKVKCARNVYETLVSENNYDEEDVVDLFKKGGLVEKRDFMIYGKKILSNYNLFFKDNKKDIIPFEWKFPQHMLDYVNNIVPISKLNEKKKGVYTMLYNWYVNNCLRNENERKKALFLFSIEGAKGKSYFARNLVPQISEGNSPYYVYCRGTLDGKEFEKKQKTAKLIIIDDVNYISKDIEIWKALTVSEPTNIRTPYYNDMWSRKLPCIILSNNISTLRYWSTEPSLNTRCVFVSVDFYIGPPDTYKKEYCECISYFTEDVKEKLLDNK